MKKQRDPGRGQLHSRGARVWRDEDNPTGPMREQEQEEQPPSEITPEPEAESPAEHEEDLHGGPSRKP